jgi:MFS transporter, DHA1 family, inner membrane transport protein
VRSPPPRLQEALTVRLPVLALALGAFAIGTTEFVTMGLLPEMADTFGVSIPTAGWLVTAYALGVVVGAPLLTAAAHRYPRRQVLIGLMVLFALGHVLSVLAPTFGVLVASRAVSALTHGAYFGASALVARQLAAPGKQGQAMALVATGVTVANVVGVPLGTAVGQNLGWRTTYALVAVLSLLTIAAIARFVPDLPASGGDLRAELAAFGRAQVWLTLAITVLGFSGMFAVLSYITPLLTEVAGYAESTVPWLLVLFGLGTTAGNLLGGRLADWSIPRTLMGGFVCLATVFTLFWVTSPHPVAAAVGVFAFGFNGFAMGTAIQARAIIAAGGGASMVAASQQAAFNVGNAIGASLGGAVIAVGFGYRAPILLAGLLAVLGLAVLLVAERLDRNGRLPVEAAVTAPSEPVGAAAG